MGMYDIFHAEAKCPHCGERDQFAFQTKKFLKTMANFKVGDQVIFDLGDFQYRIEGEVKTQGTADHRGEDGCGNQFYADIVILAGEFARIEEVRGE